MPANGDNNNIQRRSVRAQKMLANRQTIDFRHIDVDHENVRLEPVPNRPLMD